MSKFSLSLFQVLIEGIPQSFLFVFGIYIFTRIKFNAKRYLFMSCTLTLIVYLIRLLPINLGTRTMLSLLVLMILFILTNKIDLQNIVKAITSVIIITIIIAVSEELNVIFLYAIFGASKANKFLNSSTTVAIVCEIPSIVIFGLSMLISYLILNKKDKKEKITDGKDS